MRTAAAAVIGCLLCLLLRKNAPELGQTLALLVSAVTVFLAMELFSQLGELVTLAEETAGLSPAVLGPVMKCVGIGVVTGVAADLCKDAGESAVSGAVELCGAACATLAAMPLIKSFLGMIHEML